MTDRGMMSETDIIEQANADLGANAETLLDALNAFYGAGFPDVSSGDTESPTGHFYRVHRWIVVTDSQGFEDVETFDTESEAHERFETLDAEFAEWGSDE